MQLPPKNYTYLDSKGQLRDPDKYRYPKDKVEPKLHPKLIAHIKNGTDTPANRLYYRNMPEDAVLPLAGIIREEPDPRDQDEPDRPESGTPQLGSEVRDSFEISDWDDEDEGDGVNEWDGDDSSELSELESSEVEDDDDSDNDDEDDNFFPGLVQPKAPKQKVFPDLVEKNILTHDFHYEQEDSFLARPSVKLVIPDHIKAILVDDWENVTKNQQLVPLPAKHPVNSILNDYVEHERPRRQPGSAQADILEEVVSGLQLYFEKCLGRILLYR